MRSKPNLGMECNSQNKVNQKKIMDKEIEEIYVRKAIQNTKTIATSSKCVLRSNKFI